MAAVLECAADGSFDLENVADVDLDRAPSPAKPAPPSPAPPATTSASSSAAAHTYDKGYKRWEEFDADGAALEAEEAPAPAPTKREHLDGKPSAAPKEASSVDFSLPLFEKLPDEQRPYVAKMLDLAEADVASLPADQREQIEGLRKMYAIQVAEKAAGKEPGRVDAPEQRAEDIDFSLSLFDKLPPDQKEYVTQVLVLPESMIGSLPAESQDTIRSFRDMYTEQKALKKAGPAAAAEAAAKKRCAKKTPEEEAKEREKQRMKPLLQMHEEMEKMKSWPSFRESTAAWEKLETARLGALAESNRERDRRRESNVADAMKHVKTAGDASTTKAANKVKGAQKKQASRAKAKAKEDKKAQLAKLRKMAAGGLAL
ncbi:hypothetical protein AURANDRAFT_65372 [Aureococcus anophagefferens]|uniref:Uncharacterized protein n=1 Tax=Aureococcus anophagefferens TaxID=44056 RepID=F0YDC1_AURAN|nr:hypothetical protein AURANDRAFT_65372 [Aureococcus anophagefferens]EGB06831.1 hypothetical protein AURANDRAFT_65372 [Aureococcus anophagefferens]|eukprot:XP_009038576.1 hypothetical protein AURANDRAFT_65372 [Aureococcus anophagefferens]